MPFASGGIYTAPSGATDATPGAVVRSAVWNTIFTDLSTALTQVGMQLWGGPSTKTENHTVVTTDASLILNGTATITLTLLAAASYSGHWLFVKTIANQTVVSASANVVPIGTGTAGAPILAATAGKWAAMQSNGTNWVVMMAN